MLNIFVEANCNRYVRDECTYCHVYQPLMQIDRSDWHLLPEQAQLMADKIKQIDLFHQLAQNEINFTGGEPSQNPHLVVAGPHHRCPVVVGRSRSQCVDG